MKRLALLIGLGWLGVSGCDHRITDTQPVVEPALDVQLRQSLGQWGAVPIGAMPAQNPAQVALGRALFFDRILSGNRDVSCATCHDPAAGLGDGLSLPVGTGGTGHGAARTPGVGRTFVPRQSPSLLNAGLGLFYVFWDGRLTRFGPEGGIRPIPGPTFPAAQDNVLIAQAMLPVLNRAEMRGNPGDLDVFGNQNELAQLGDDQNTAVWQAIMKRLMAVPEYVELFAAAFPGKPGNSLTFDDAARALAVFQMEAFTRTRSPFDRFLERDDGALTVEQKRGAILFFGEARCASCHSGPFMGGQQFANVGVPQIGPGSSKQPPLDLGRAEVQNNEFYRFAFRVAPLRNVELTAPYMHSGAYPTLEAVVRHYNNPDSAQRNYNPSHLSPSVRAMHHGDAATVKSVLETLDFRLRQPLRLTGTEQTELVAFLKSLTDPAARNLGSIVPASVPSGLSVRD